MKVISNYAHERASGVKTYIAGLKTITPVNQISVGYYLNNLRGCSVVATDERDFSFASGHMTTANMTYEYQVSRRFVQSLKQCQGLASSVSMAVMLVLLMERDYEVHH
jgi:hypothetical protein